MNNKLRVVCHFLGQIVILFSVGMLVPFLYSFVIGERIWSLLLAAVITACFGWGLKKSGNSGLSISLSQGFVIVGFAWIFASFFGALPYYLGGYLPRFIDALFESTSGFTATGATVFVGLDTIPRALVLYRSMTHWIGGMGIIILVLAFLKSLGMEASHLFHAEAAVNGYGQVMPRIREYAKTLWGLYVLLSLTAVLILWCAGMAPFDALNYGMSIIATGGFTPSGAGAFAYADSYLVQAAMVLFMIIAGGNFGLYYLAWKKGFRLVWRDTEFRVYLSLLFGGAAVIAVALYTMTDAGGGIKTWMASLFTMVSIQTGSGFAVADYDLWPPMAKAILYSAMFIGGCSGSTTGAIKVVRFILIAKAAGMYLQQLVHPGMVKVVKHNGKSVTAKELTGTLLFFVSYLMVYFVSVILVAMTGFEMDMALTSVAGILGNVGLAFGELGPTDSFAAVHPLAKGVFVIDMLLGRLELFTLLVMLHPGFWRPFLQKDKVRF